MDSWNARLIGEPEDSDWMPIAPNIFVPYRFEAEGELDGYKVHMVIETDVGLVDCVKLTVEAVRSDEFHDRRRDGLPTPLMIRGETLRGIPVAFLVKEAVKQVMVEQLDQEGDLWLIKPDVDENGKMLPDTLELWPKGILVDYFIETVARIYRRAAAIGDPPNVAVQHATGFSRATVNRILKLAREAGHLSAEDDTSFAFGGTRSKAAARLNIKESDK